LPDPTTWFSARKEYISNNSGRAISFLQFTVKSAIARTHRQVFDYRRINKISFEYIKNYENREENSVIRWHGAGSRMRKLHFSGTISSVARSHHLVFCHRRLYIRFLVTNMNSGRAIAL
jgi:hypothetical protein